MNNQTLTLGLGLLLLIESIFFLGEAFPLGEATGRMHISTGDVALASGQERYVMATMTVPSDGYVTSFYPRIESRTPGLLHHALLFYSGSKNPYCPDRPHFIYATGSELKIMYDSLGPDYGIFVRKGETFTLAVHMANATPEVQHGTFSLLLEKEENRKEVIPVPLSVVDYCTAPGELSDGIYTIAQGITSHTATMERPFVSPKNGAIIGVNGHLHTYGTSLTLSKNQSPFIALHPLRNPEGHVDAASVYLPGNYFPANPLMVKEGDAFTIQASYEKPADLHYEEAMGGAFLYITVTP